MRYRVPVIGAGTSSRDARRPAYVELLGHGVVVEDQGDFFIVEIHTGPPDFEPCKAPGHDELLGKPGVTLA